MKMKKLFVGVLSVLLVLSMAGMVSGLEGVQTVNNTTVIGAGALGWMSDPVNVTLNLENDFVVTIPADFNLERNTAKVTDNDGKPAVYYTTHHTDTTPSSVLLGVDVTLLEKGKNVTVNVTSNDYDYGYSVTNVDSQGHSGAWNLTATDASDSVIHYLLSAGTTHFLVTGASLNGQYPVSVGTGSKLITNNSNIVKTNSSVDVPLHVIVIDKPEHVAKYQGQLKFTVKVE